MGDDMNIGLSGVALWVGALVLCAVTGCSTLTPTPRNAPEGLLEGTGWQLQQLGAQGAIAGNQPTLSFAQMGRVSGTGSCNQFNGPVTVSGKSIAFGALASTRMACSDALNKQESTYLKALGQAEWFTVAGSTLTIYTKAMDQPLVFFRTSPP
jgi:heat shock protein HslJ